MKYKGIEIGNNPVMITLRSGKVVEAARCTIDSVPHYFKYIDVRGKVVMDIGAHYGTFVVRAFEHGATSVVAFEPTPSSFKLLKRNAGRNPHAVLYKAAIVGGGRMTTMLYVCPNGRAGANSTTKAGPKSKALRVSCLNFKYMLDEHRPEVLKDDAEGAEYDLLLGKQLPKFVH